VSYVRHFVACNQHDFARFAPLTIGGRRYGYIERGLAAQLPQETGVFTARDNGLDLIAADNFKARTDALMKATQWIAAHYGKKLRNEMYAVVEKWGDTPVAQIDRIGIPWFGMRAWGVHVNGFVRKTDGIHLWIGERAADRPADAGKFDNLIGGGHPFGLTMEENLCKEAKEEAGIDADLAMTSKFIRTLDYRVERSEGLRSDTLFIYDLELPEGYTPRNTDGEVAAFHLMPLSQVAALVRDTDKFKFNCNLVAIDFLMRRGFITDADPEYGELVNWLKG
jgi:8-oxo-dGTP pyrophosphatase MutT (NUDIX family)